MAVKGGASEGAKRKSPCGNRRGEGKQSTKKRIFKAKGGPTTKPKQKGRLIKKTEKKSRAKREGLKTDQQMIRKGRLLTTLQKKHGGTKKGDSGIKGRGISTKTSKEKGSGGTLSA